MKKDIHRAKRLRDFCSDEDKARLSHIEGHVRGIFAKTAPIKYYIPHDPEHFKRVEEILDELIPADMKEHLKPKEIFYLLCGAWLHDVGLLKHPQGMSDVEIRKQHHILSHEYIVQTIKDEDNKLGLNSFEGNFIADLALWHRRSMDIEECAKKYKEIVDGQPTRCELLGALLRLADGLDVSYQRTYEPLYLLYMQFHMPAENWIHWVKHRISTKAICKPNEQAIQLSVMVPDDKRDYSLLTKVVENEVRDELNSVKDILRRSNIVYYDKVEMHMQKGILPNKQHEELIKAVGWMEVAEAVNASYIVETILGMIEWIINSWDIVATPAEAIKELLTEATNLRQRNFAIANIAKQITDIIEQPTEKEIRNTLHELIQKIRNERKTSLSKIAESSMGLLNDGDGILLYGYSATVLAVLEASKHKNSIRIFVCECRNKSKKGYNEGIILAEKIRDIGFQQVFIISDISIGHYISKDGITKVFVGADGIWPDGSFVSTVGHKTVAITAKALGVPVYVFADSHKIADIKKWSDDQRPPGDLFPDPILLSRLDTKNIAVLNESSDKVEPEYVQFFITDKGKFRPSEIGH